VTDDHLTTAITVYRRLGVKVSVLYASISDSSDDTGVIKRLARHLLSQLRETFK